MTDQEMLESLIAVHKEEYCDFKLVYEQIFSDEMVLDDEGFYRLTSVEHLVPIFLFNRRQE